MGELIQFPAPELNLGLKPRTTPTKPAATPRPPTIRTPAPNPFIRPTRSNNCHACGSNPRAYGSRYCTPCTSAGLDSPIINCNHPGCTTVGKRRYTGQQSFWCPRHHPGRKS